MDTLGAGKILLFARPSDADSLKSVLQAEFTVTHSADDLFVQIPDSFDGAIIAGVSLDAESAAAVLKALKPASRVVVKNVTGSERSLLFGGFVSIECRSTGEVVGTKPAWEQPASAPLKLNNAVPDSEASVWALDAEDLGEDRLADEDALLAQDDLKGVEMFHPSAGGAPIDEDDCGVSGQKTRKACKNCSCGRAERELAQVPSNVPVPVTSNCGNCALGDAFRCGGCPYRGMPVFKPGEVIKLDL